MAVNGSSERAAPTVVVDQANEGEWLVIIPFPFWCFFIAGGMILAARAASAMMMIIVTDPRRGLDY